MTQHTDVEMQQMTPREFRSLVRKGEWTGSTKGFCRGYAVTDVAIVPKEYAYDFLVFCHRNPLTCPLIEITDVGSPHPQRMAPDADLRTDLPKYMVYKEGQVVDEPTDIREHWRDDLVAFLLGEAGSFHWSWEAAHIPFESKGTFSTNIPCVPVGPFRGNVAVSCKLFKNAHDLVRAIQIASRHILFHGPPIHIGDPAAIGIRDLSQPDLIRYPQAHASDEGGRIAAFWPCFGTVRGVAKNARLPLMIVDYPLHNFMTDRPAEAMAVL